MVDLFIKKVIALLKRKGWHIAAAESCTAGAFSATIAEIPGASAIMNMGFITYSEEAKIKLVGVHPETIKQYGVVSEEVATEMAEGAAKQACAEVGVGITGYAGPTGGTEKVPVGTVCIGLYIKEATYIKTFHLDITKERNVIRREIVNITMKWFYDLLIEQVVDTEMKDFLNIHQIY